MTEMTDTRTIGVLVAENPVRARFFESLGIDYCCNGNRTLRQAAIQAGLEPETLERVFGAFDTMTLTRAGDTDTGRLRDMEPVELVEYIVDTHHRYLREELPRIEALAGKVLTAHGERDVRLAEVAEVVRDLAADLLLHLESEEKGIFLRIRSGISAIDPQSIEKLRSEHNDVGRSLEALSTLTDGYTPPEWACNTYRAFLDSLSRLERDTHAHVHTENNILFEKILG